MLATNFSAQTRLEALLVLGAVIIVVVFINLTLSLSKPFGYLGTMIHELGHVVVTAVTGGIAKGFWVYRKPRDGVLGEAEREGGTPPFVIPAGYLGTTLFSVGLILLSGLPYFAPYTLGFLGVILILLVLSFGRSFFTWFIGLAFGVVFILVAWQAELIWSVFLLNLVAIQGGLLALGALRELGSVARGHSTSDDASKMAALFGRWPLFSSPIFWVRVWFLFSILILVAAFWFTWFRGLTG